MNSMSLKFFIVLLLSYPVYSQSILDRAEYARKPTSIKIPQISSSYDRISVLDTARIGFTDYDYSGNTGLQDQFAFYDWDLDGNLDPIGIYMQRFSETGDGVRRVVMYIALENETGVFPVSDTTVNSGWGTFHIFTEGPWANRAAIMFYAEGKTNFTLVDLKTFGCDYFHEELDFCSLSSSFCYVDEKTIYVIDVQGNLLTLTTENPTSSVETGIIFHPSASNYLIKKSPNGQYLAAMAFNEDDQVILYYSDDFGVTWNNEVIGENLVDEVINRPGTYPLFSNFGQASYVLDNTGVVHVGMNGYGIHIDGNDTTFAYPALYWNSSDKQWLAVSDSAEEGEELNGLYSGNGIGNAFPTPIISKTGSNVIILYQAPEYENGVLQIYEGDGTANNHRCYYTNIKYGVPGWRSSLIVGQKHRSEYYPTAIDTIEKHNGTPPQIWSSQTWRFLYMVDATPGCSIFDENSSDENSYWAYYTYFISTTDIKEKTKNLSYLLNQNYPNPFNPSTKISFTLPNNNFVLLKIFDAIGREVKTLVNEVKLAGNYEVEFDASSLSSGIYFYRLSAGNFTETKKMLLIK